MKPTPLLVLTLLAACNRAPEMPTYSISLAVEGDPGSALPGAAILRDNAEIAVTTAKGTALVRLHGSEGEMVPLAVRCPEGYTSPSAPVSVLLRKLADPAKLPSYRVSCPPQTRSVVVAVRANNGPNLPVLYLGREVARTDPSGAAHLELRLRPSERFELTLATSEKGAERLIPQNPTAVFVVKDQDELLFFDQQFTRPAAPARAPRRVGPTPIPAAGLRHR